MQRIVLFSMNSCSHCDTVKKFLEQKKVAFRLCNVKSPSGQKEFNRTGLRSVPALKYGEQVIANIDVKKLAKLLKI